jgi:hypothetical protein
MTAALRSLGLLDLLSGMPAGAPVAPRPSMPPRGKAPVRKTSQFLRARLTNKPVQDGPQETARCVG